ncbi:MAG: hypothetical protein EBR34_08100 [Sphingomonadaceae bacterium]|nr:hypothetical protein [Sphingomonadaceae bacterium]
MGSGSGNVLQFGKRAAAPPLSVMEFLVGMALCRRGGSTSSQIRKETSRLFDASVEEGAIMEALVGIEGRGWASRSGREFAIAETGVEVMQTFFTAMVRLLDGGRGLLDVSVLTSIVREFERKG